MNITKWSPDTCTCIINYEWDPATSLADRIHTYTTTDKTCPTHANLVGQSLYDTLVNENQLKNSIEAALLGWDDLAEDKQKPDGSTVRNFKIGVIYDWRFTGLDDARHLEIQILGITITPLIEGRITTALAGLDQTKFTVL